MRTVEYALHVHGKDVIPSLLFGEVVVGASPCDARVVDEDMQLLFALFELFDEGITTLPRLRDIDEPQR